MSQIARELLEILKQKNLTDQLPEIVEDLRKELYRSQKITIISAKELSSTELKKLSTETTKNWGDHEIVTSVDPSLLSGVLIRFGHQVIDRSGKTKLTDLSASLS